MGSNKRYAEARALVPTTLTDEQVGPTRRSGHVPARAWVQFGQQSVLVVGTAVE